MCFVAVKVVKLTHAIARILEREKIRAGRRTTFGTGVAVPSVVLLPASMSWTSAALCRGGRDCGVVAASNIPQGVHGSNHSHGYFRRRLFPAWKGQAKQKHCQKKIVVWADTIRKTLLEFPHEDVGLEALHLHGKSKQLNIGLPFAQAKLF